RREDLAAIAIRVVAQRPTGDGWWAVEVEFGGAAHAGAAMWQLGDDAELLGPSELREQVRSAAERLAERHR
ncbi:MAG: WYL domain-containing protein, partial [Rhodococcus sp. (in: high G+C Gram-positive bacteria)]|nr:WYL domain-containing protein [Rhodococcus sp. (in: high G+C Gram-positive bacteria)]MDX5451472.1 WYL domain-containing protein [Rhodococcus sp. (in: high G+C Gram-positive bacteria)]